MLPVLFSSDCVGRGFISLYLSMMKAVVEVDVFIGIFNFRWVFSVLVLMTTSEDGFP